MQGISRGKASPHINIFQGNANILLYDMSKRPELYGFTAIIVAFLGRLNPIGVIFAGILLAISYLGGEAAQVELGISDKMAQVFQGMLLFLILACETLIHYRIKIAPGLGAAKEA